MMSPRPATALALALARMTPSVAWIRPFALPAAALIVSLAGSVPALGQAIEPTRQFRAGAAKLDITPALGAPIIGGFRPMPAAHIHDPLHVRALALDNGEATLVVVVCDLLGVPQEVTDEAKRVVYRELGVLPNQVIIAATHTHSAGSALNPGAEVLRPMALGTELGPYQQFVVRRIADAVRLALNNLEPARIGRGSGNAPSLVSNRRWFIDSENDRRNPFGGVDQVRMNPPAGSPDLIAPAGPTDPELVYLSLQALDGRPLALLANFSLHYVGGVPANTISADYFGMFADRIQELLGADRQSPPFVGILTNGTSGDISGSDRRQVPESRAPFERMRQVAHELAAEVHRALPTVDHVDWVPLGSRLETIALSPRRPSPEMVQRAREVLRRGETDDPWHPQELLYADRLLLMAEAPEVMDFPLQAFRIGDVGIAAIPMEVFVEIGLEIKERSPFASTFTLSMANGYFGYLPTVEHHRLGGYETWVATNRVEIGAAPKIVEALTGYLQELKPE